MKTLYLFLFTILFIILGTSPDLAVALTNITTDHYALLALKSHLSLDPSHTLSINWSDSSSTSVCNWIGVTCGSRHQRVTGLDLSYMNLTTILPPQIGNLSFLVSLNLSSNDFYSNMPRELTRLRRLRILDFSFNSLGGEIPSWFNFMSKLDILYLQNNSFTGFIPPLSNMSNIETLDFSYNTLQGGIPTEIGGLVNLKTLLLYGNEISGSIPSMLFNMSTLEILDLTSNRLQGILPESICNTLSRLEQLRVSVNYLSGGIPTNLSNCSRLQILALSFNRFSGSIPTSIGNLRSLELLYLGANNFSGQIPDELRNITTLRNINLNENQFTGPITATTFNISSLESIGCGGNNLFGTLPEDMYCTHLKQLQRFDLGENYLDGPLPTRLHECTSLSIVLLFGNNFSGVLPKEIGNATLLEGLYLFENQLTGVIPQEIGNLINLQELVLSRNAFSGNIPASVFNITTLMTFDVLENQLVGTLPPDMGLGIPYIQWIDLASNNLTSLGLSFLTSFTNCVNLTNLYIDNNPFGGVIPSFIGNFSTSIQYLGLNNCGFEGSIPHEIGNLTGLVMLTLRGNNLTGTFPTSLSNLQIIQSLDLSINNITGTIPSNICEWRSLITFYLHENEFYGPIPQCIGDITTLNALDLSNNKLNGTLPTSLWDIRDILNLNLSSNSLTGTIPVEVGNLRTVSVIDVSRNQLSGTIPATIGDLQELVNFSLAHNTLHGSIPETMADMVNLDFLDLSHNNLSGGIPVSLKNLVHLNYLDVSFNDLSGEIPSGGPFDNFTSQSFMFNKGLCGDPRYNVNPCHEIKAGKAKGKWRLRVIFIILGALIFLIVIVLLAYKFASDRKKRRAPNSSNIWVGPTQMRISYYELSEATDRYSENNLIGSGSFGSVYKGTLRNGKVVAVKVFHEQREGAFLSFEVECETLGKLRHRNLCKVIGCCSNEEFKALILDYMPNGSLEGLLYSTNSSLDLVQRISIMVDVASALEYLHFGYSTTIVHCDLKPSNILLDENMVGHLCDFGLAKLLGDGETTTQTMTLATLGYIAPEFGTDGRVSIKGDVYSYGITMMEVFTRMKPNDEFFIGDSTIKSWVEDAMAGDIDQIVDPSIMHAEEEERSILKLNCVHAILELALRCSRESPCDRINLKDVHASLKKIRDQLLLRSEFQVAFI